MSERRRHPVLAAFLSALVPGLGQLYAGRIRRALVFFLPALALLVGAIVLYDRGAVGILELAVQPNVLRGVLIIDALALVWRVWAAVDAYVVTAPPEQRTEVSKALLVVLVVFVAIPHVASAVPAYRGLTLVENVFAAPVDAVDVVPPPQPTLQVLVEFDNAPDPQLFYEWYDPIERSTRNLIFRKGVGDPDAIDALVDILHPPSIVDAPFLPFEERVDPGRLTILLVGGDAGPGRSGLRTDTMMVATIDTDTGQAAIFGIPRNFKYIPVPAHMRGVWEDMERRAIEETWTDLDEDGFPDQWVDLDGDEIPDEPEFESCDCYPEMLNTVHAQTSGWTRSYPNSPDPGMSGLRDVLQTMLGINIDYYILVDMAAFVRGIDVIGGVTVMVQEPLHVTVSAPWEGAEKASVNVEPGINHLDGFEALAFSRWRWGSSDYARMERQRCLVRSAVAQADPFTLLRNFGEIADIIEEFVVTDIPVSFLPDVVRVAGKIDFANIATVGLVPPTYHNDRAPGGYPIPDVGKIRWKVGKVLEEGAPAQSSTGDSECGI